MVKILEKLQEKTNVYFLLSTDTGVQTETLPKRRFHHGCLPSNFLSFIKTPINKGLCLLELQVKSYLKNWMQDH